MREKQQERPQRRRGKEWRHEEISQFKTLMRGEGKNKKRGRRERKRRKDKEQQDEERKGRKK